MTRRGSSLFKIDETQFKIDFMNHVSSEVFKETCCGGRRKALILMGYIVYPKKALEHKIKANAMQENINLSNSNLSNLSDQEVWYIAGKIKDGTILDAVHYQRLVAFLRNVIHKDFDWLDSSDKWQMASGLLAAANAPFELLMKFMLSNNETE